MGHIETIEALLSAGANIDFEDPLGYTSISKAAQTLRLDVVKYLLSKGATNLSRGIVTVMYYPTGIETAKEIINLLLENGADINNVDEYKHSALYSARESVSITKLLLEKGADPNIQDKYGRTALMYAIDDISGSANIESIKELLNSPNIDLNIRNSRGETALMVAIDVIGIRSGSLEAAKMISSDQRADPNIQCNFGEQEGMTALSFCMIKEKRFLEYEDRLTLTKNLLSNGADINLMDKSGKSPLVYAVENGYSEIQELMANSLNK